MPHLEFSPKGRWIWQLENLIFQTRCITACPHLKVTFVHVGRKQLLSPVYPTCLWSLQPVFLFVVSSTWLAACGLSYLLDHYPCCSILLSTQSFLDPFVILLKLFIFSFLSLSSSFLSCHRGKLDPFVCLQGHWSVCTLFVYVCSTALDWGVSIKPTKRSGHCALYVFLIASNWWDKSQLKPAGGWNV